MSKPNLFCVVFRTGGTLNFQWRRSVAFTTLAEAEATAEAVRIMGYVAHVEHHGLSLSVGLPETYEAGGYPIDPEDWVEAEDREEVRCLLGRLEDTQEEVALDWDPDERFRDWSDEA